MATPGEADESIPSGLDEAEEEQDPPEIDWDWTCNVALPHFAFITQYMLPLRHIQLKTNEAIKREFQDAVSTPSGTSLKFVGSVTSGLELPKVVNREFHDISLHTILIVPDDITVYKSIQNLAETTGVHLTAHGTGKQSGFVKLKINKGEKVGCEIEEKDTMYLSVEALNNKYKIQLPEASDKSMMKRLEKASVAIRCPSWPNIAKEWSDRKRPSEWPTKELVDSIVQDGCHLIPGHHPNSKDTNTEWEWDFSVAEQKLAKTLTDYQRQCFLLFKMLYYIGFDYPYFITEDHLKWIFYMVCDRIPQSEWTEQEIAPIMLCLVDEVLHALINGELPHYFIAKRNTIDHIPEDFIFDLMERVSKTRQNALQYLYRFNKIYKFSFWPKTQNLEDIFAPLMKDMEDQHDKIRDSMLNGLNPSGEALAICHIKEDNFAEACNIQADLLKMLQAHFGEANVPYTLVSLLESLAMSLGDLDYTIKFFEYILDTYPEGRTYSAKGNLACFYSNKYHTLPADDPDKGKLLQKTKDLFQEAISDPNASGATFTDYSNFLCGTGDHETAIPYLKRVLEKEKDTMVSSNMYGPEEIATVDGNVQREIQTAGQISVPAVVYSIYLLIMAYKKLNREDEARDLIKDFEEVVDSMETVTVIQSCSLLGYAYKSLEMHLDAFRAFHKAANLAVNHKKECLEIATENRDTCKAILASQGIVVETTGPGDSADTQDENIAAGKAPIEKEDIPEGDGSVEAKEDSPEGDGSDETKEDSPEGDGSVEAKKDIPECDVSVKAVEDALATLESLQLTEKKPFGSLFVDENSRTFRRMANSYFDVQETNKVKQHERLIEIEAFFAKTQEEASINIKTSLDYATFKCKINQHADAIPCLLQILDERNSYVPINYGATEMSLVDDNMQREIESIVGNILILPMAIYTLYLLVGAYIQTDQKEEAVLKMSVFETLVAAMKPQNQCESLCLMGYSYQALDMHQEAYHCFKVVYSRNVSYKLAEENRDLCQAVLLSQGITLESKDATEYFDAHFSLPEGAEVEDEQPQEGVTVSIDSERFPLVSLRLGPDQPKTEDDSHTKKETEMAEPDLD